ncbi:CBS domain-containing protein [Nesterenkonia sp. Act20]|uniref:CBS domain-containing protein n=1 Tax=Nesterenkonia sp. Act20 TaxID=1483432 RepID=UPI001C45E809|nr:CBS domain-containing protein [Nesterenkonia sp. Act20]
MTTVREIMTEGAQCLGEHQSLEEAAQKLKDLEVGALPICLRDGRVIGLLTERHIVRKCVAIGTDPSHVTAGEIGEDEPVTIAADEPVEGAIEMMSTHQVSLLPVVERHTLVGMLSEADIARSMPGQRFGELVEEEPTWLRQIPEPPD